MHPADTVRIGFLIFPGMLQLDFTGAYGVFAAAGERVELFLIWKDLSPVTSCDKLSFTPTTTFDDCPPLDALIVPGGEGVAALMADEDALRFLRLQSKTVGFLASVCTGALVLGAAGLLAGYKATTHWLSRDMLLAFGAEPINERVVKDRERITSAGVTAGIDMALTLAGGFWGEEVAMAVQLTLEYAPAPPYAAGVPESAPPAVAAALRKKTQRVKKNGLPP